MNDFSILSELVGSPFEDYIPPSWDEWFIKQTYLVASKSKDKKTKIGAIIVKDNIPLISGYNGFCRGVNDNILDRHERPAKYSWAEHAERNSIYFAARKGISVEGGIMYTNGIPCVDCARGIVQSGITKVIIHAVFEDLWTELKMEQLMEKNEQSKWTGHDQITTTMFKEAGIKIIKHACPVGSYAYLNGNKYVV